MLFAKLLYVTLFVLCAWAAKTAKTVKTAKTAKQEPAKPSWVCNGDDEIRIKGKFEREYHWLCLREQKIAMSPLLARKSFLYVDPFAKNKELLRTNNITLVHGYTIGEVNVGTAEGYISEEEEFVGVLHYRNRTIYADSFDGDIMKTFGKFRNDHVAPPTIRVRRSKPFNQGRRRRIIVTSPATREDEDFDNTTILSAQRWVSKTKPPHSPDYTNNYETNKPLPVYAYSHKLRADKRRKTTLSEFVITPVLPDKQFGVAKARVCELLLLADHSFFLNDANRNLGQAVRRMFHTVAQADLIFRNADFDNDGMPDNIGFTVKYVMVLTSDATNRRLFGDLLDKVVVDGHSYLMRFARLRRLGDVCLGVAFTGHAFQNRTLGLSFTSLNGGKGAAAGGICDRRAYGRSFNTLAVAHAGRGDGMRLPVRLAAVTLAHELGHSFGAHHDEVFPNQGCDDYIMGQNSMPGDTLTHFEFSMCSKKLIKATIDSVGYCLVYDDRPYCGNGIVEAGEMCDCGLPGRCALQDKCCTPRSGASAGTVGDRSVHVKGCSVAPTALCHPSQGRCCDLNCRFADLTIDGIECSRMQDTCPCDSVDSSGRCPCGLGGECLPDGTCTAAECARLGLKECACPHHGPGGAVGAVHRCGVCCVMSGELEEARCASAETAARAELAAGRVLLEDLRDDDYSGPSVFFKMCLAEDVPCAYVSLRAWFKRGTCISLGEVGECTPSGVCIPYSMRPRAHIYPHVAAEEPFRLLTELKSTKSTANENSCSKPVMLILLSFMLGQIF